MTPLYPFLFIDLETTGHNATAVVDGILQPWHEIIEIGAVMADQEHVEIRAEFELKVMPDFPERCNQGAVNDFPDRFTRGDWRTAVPLQQAIVQFLRWILRHAPEGKALPVGQNPAFDWSFLLIAFARCDITDQQWENYLHYGRLDTRSMAVQALWQPGTSYDPNAYSLRNDELATRLGVKPEPYPHEAINGARTSYAVFRSLHRLKEVSSGRS